MTNDELSVQYIFCVVTSGADLQRCLHDAIVLSFQFDAPIRFVHNGSIYEITGRKVRGGEQS